MRGTSRTARPHPRGHRDRGRADRKAEKNAPAHKRTVQSELCGGCARACIAPCTRGSAGLARCVSCFLDANGAPRDGIQHEGGGLA